MDVSSYLKLPEVAHRLGVSEKTARRYIKAGALPSIFVGNAYRVHPNELEAFVERTSVDHSVGEEPDAPKAPSSSPKALESQVGEERSPEDVWRAEYLARADEMLNKWEDEFEEKAALAESDPDRFKEWVREIREFGTPHMMGLVSAYAAVATYKLEAVIGVAKFLGPWDDLWRRIEPIIDTIQVSEEDVRRFQEWCEDAQQPKEKARRQGLAA